MAKKGLSLKTGAFGPPPEFYLASLLQLAINPLNSRRPDLLSTNGHYDPRLTLEVKGSNRDIGILYEGQFHYALSLAQDYQVTFGEILPRIRRARVAMPTEPVPIAFYYGSVHRTDDLGPADIDRPYASIQVELGDVKIVPAAFAFFSFATQRALSERRPVREVVRQLKQQMARDYQTGASYEYRDTSSFKGLYGGDILALFFNDMGRASKLNRTDCLDGQRRVDALRRAYPQVDDLKRLSIPGPNGTTLYVLAEPEHARLFHNQMRSTVRERTPILEAVIEERRRARRTLRLIDPESIEDHFTDFGHSAQRVVRKLGVLGTRGINRLERLVRFLPPGETTEVVPVEHLQVPSDGIPF